MDKDSKNTKSNVVGIGHNSNEYSKVQYAKVVNSLHHILLYARQEADNINCMLDGAFTGFRNSNPDGQKLKLFETHQLRNEAKARDEKLYEYLSKRIEKVEASAKAEGIELELNKKSSEDSND
jgi:hypothetical protein